jgi:hypothetical protein
MSRMGENYANYYVKLPGNETQFVHNGNVPHVLVGQNLPVIIFVTGIKLYDNFGITGRALKNFLIELTLKQFSTRWTKRKAPIFDFHNCLFQIAYVFKSTLKIKVLKKNFKSNRVYES